MGFPESETKKNSVISKSQLKLVKTGSKQMILGGHQRIDTAVVQQSLCIVSSAWLSGGRAPRLCLNFSTGAAPEGCGLEPKDLISPNQHIVIH